MIFSVIGKIPFNFTNEEILCQLMSHVEVLEEKKSKLIYLNRQQQSKLVLGDALP